MLENVSCFVILDPDSLLTNGQNGWRRGLRKKPLIVAAMYPCPCGFYGDSRKPSTGAPAMVTKYQKRISGPLLDRIDMHIEVPRGIMKKLNSNRMGRPAS